MFPYFFLLQVQVQQKNFTGCMHSLIHIDTFNRNDTAIQMARCSFDIHVQEIFGILSHGATLIMLHPRGTMDLDYLANILYEKQISYVLGVPSLLHTLFHFLNQMQNSGITQTLRSICSGGK